MPDALPDKATALDTPIDYAALNNQIAAQTNAMVTSGTASPGAAAGGGIIAGLIIAAVDAGIDANRNSKLRTMLEDQEFNAHSIFKEALEDALEEHDMPLTFASGERKDREMFSTEALSNVSGDAALDIRVLNYGYRITPAGWVPSVAADLVMKDPSSGKTLMTERIVYGSPGNIMIVSSPYVAAPNGFLGGSAIVVPYETGYSFSKLDNLTDEQPEKAAAGLRLALVHTAKAIADLVAPASRESPMIEPSGTEAAAEVAIPLDAAAPLHSDKTSELESSDEAAAVEEAVN